MGIMYKRLRIIAGTCVCLCLCVLSLLVLWIITIVKIPIWVYQMPDYRYDIH